MLVKGPVALTRQVHSWLQVNHQVVTNMPAIHDFQPRMLASLLQSLMINFFKCSSKDDSTGHVRIL